MRRSVPNVNALMSSSMLCSGFSKSTTWDRAAGPLQHPNTAHTNAHNPRIQRNRLREHGQIIDFLWSSLRFEYAHHETRFSHSPSRKLVANSSTRKKAWKKMFALGQGSQSFKPRPIFQRRSIFPTPLNLPTPLKTVIPSGADRPFLPPSLLRRSRSAKSRNLSSSPREANSSTPHSLIPSPPPLESSTSESPPTSVAIAPQILDPSACNKSAPPDYLASTSCP